MTNIYNIEKSEVRIKMEGVIEFLRDEVEIVERAINKYSDGVGSEGLTRHLELLRDSLELKEKVYISCYGEDQEAKDQAAKEEEYEMEYERSKGYEEMSERDLKNDI